MGECSQGPPRLLSEQTQCHSRRPAPKKSAAFSPERWTPAAECATLPWLSPSHLSPSPPRPLSRNLRALTSDVFISSISAKVGALSRTRGRGRCVLLPASVTDRLMQDVDLVSPEQALRMQGREPNPGGGREVGQDSRVRGADGVGR